MKEVENNVQLFWREVEEGKARVLKDNDPWPKLPDYHFIDIWEYFPWEK